MFSGGSTARAQAVNLNPQPWRWSHPRVLVEHPDEATGLAIASGLRFGWRSGSIVRHLLTVPSSLSSTASR
jgi:hypothetical protein